MPARWRLFLAATAVICAAPGPNMLFVMASSVRSGFRRTLAAMAGCLTGLVLMMAASSAGAGTLLAAAPRAFAAIEVSCSRAYAAGTILIGLAALLAFS